MSRGWEVIDLTLLYASTYDNVMIATDLSKMKVGLVCIIIYKNNNIIIIITIKWRGDKEGKHDLPQQQVSNQHIWPSLD